MSVLEVYEALLIELSRVEAPNILLEDFNYYLNKAKAVLQDFQAHPRR